MKTQPATRLSLRPSLRRSAAAAIAISAGLFLGACASTPPPTSEIAVSEAAVANAVRTGAPELAPAEMSAARDKLESAKRAVANDDNMLARRLAQQSLADAQSAAAKAEAIKARKAADELAEANRVLRLELNRKATQ